jgi:hypothetical protein
VAGILGHSDASGAEPMSPGKKKAPLKYAMQLPQYCWGQYFGRTEPQYQLPSKKVCGVGTNHFCTGLINLYQGRDERKDLARKQALGMAKQNIRYTQDYIAPYPNCPLHADVKRALLEVEALQAVAR